MPRNIDKLSKVRLSEDNMALLQDTMNRAKSPIALTWLANTALQFGVPLLRRHLGIKELAPKPKLKHT